MTSLIAIAAGGAIGAVCRWALSSLIASLVTLQMPIHTICVNIIGCLVMGVVLGVSEKVSLSPTTVAFLTVGCLGAFTTFSTYALEVVRLLKSGEWVLALTYFLISNILGIVALIIGWWSVLK